MDFKFKSQHIELSYCQNKGAEKYGNAVVKAFFKVMQIIKSVRDEQDLRAFKGLHYEKLQGDRAHQHSMRLNDQFRLIVEIKKEQSK
jgi:proteic killer suppression protein